MDVCELFVQLIESEKERRRAEENLRIIREQFDFRGKSVVPKGFWDMIKKEGLYDSKTFEATSIFTGDMDAFIQDAKKGFFSEEQISNVYRPWDLAIKTFISQKSNQIEVIKQLIKEKFEEFALNNPELSMQTETFNSLLQFIMG